LTQRSEAGFRVLQVSEAAGGGVLQMISSLSAGVHAAGHQVDVAYGRRPETPADVVAALPAGIGVHELPWTGRRSIAAQGRAGGQLRRLIRSLRPDVVHLHSSFAGLIGSLYIPRDIPTVYSPHAYAFMQPDSPRALRGAYLMAEMFTARRCQLVGCVSHSEADLARRYVRAPNVLTVPNGIPDLDPEALAARPPVAMTDDADRPPLVVAMGRIAPQKRAPETADILVALRDQADVAWIGGGSVVQDAKLRAAGVPVTGWLSHEAALVQLDRASVYLHWSAFDGQPMSVLEALARDVVVVASDIAPNREIVGPRQVVGSAGEATELTRRIITDRVFHDELLAEQRLRRSRWSAERMSSRWLDVYRHLTSMS
jgi:glycosyltransferase involved in cell wall biosynthesis